MKKKILTRQVGVLFSDKIYKRLIQLTNAEEVSLSEFIREIVEDRLTNSNNTEEDKDEKYH